MSSAKIMRNKSLTRKNLFIFSSNHKFSFQCLHKKSSIALHRTFFSAIVICLLPGSSAHAVELKARYEVSVGALSVGQATLTSQIENKQYHVQATMTFAGLAGLITNLKGAAAAVGTHTNGVIKPANFFAKAKSGTFERIIRMQIQQGTAYYIDISPPLAVNPGNSSIEAIHRKAIVDPLSAMLMPVATGRDILHKDNCNRTLPILDGGARMTISLSYKETKEVSTKTYKGQVLVCSARYTHIAGFQANEASTRYMQNNKNMTVWLAPIEGTRFLAPLRAHIQTAMGTATFEAMRWNISTRIAQAH